MAISSPARASSTRETRQRMREISARHPDRRVRARLDRREQGRQAALRDACSPPTSRIRSRRSVPQLRDDTWPGCRRSRPRRRHRTMQRTSPALARIEPSAPALVSGARMVVEALEREGVRHVFGYPGGAIMPVYDALTGSSLHPHPGAARAGRGASPPTPMAGSPAGPASASPPRGRARPTSSPASPTRYMD